MLVAHDRGFSVPILLVFAVPQKTKMREKKETKQKRGNDNIREFYQVGYCLIYSATNCLNFRTIKPLDYVNVCFFGQSVGGRHERLLFTSSHSH